MANPDFSSFVSSNQYTKENLTFPFSAGMILGTGYTDLQFNGLCGAAGNDPGGLFGWLIYSRATKYDVPKGDTSSSYILYNDPYELVSDINKLGGITACLISATGAGGTYGFFDIGINSYLIPKTVGNDFLHALNYLAYGGSLVISGSVGGLINYTLDENTSFDVLVDRNLTSDMALLLKDQPYTIGIFPTIPGSDGVTGSGYTMANYAALFGNASLVTGTTVANRVFNVCGVKAIVDLNTSSLRANSKLTYEIPAVNDVAGFFARTKSRNESYLSVAGLDRSTIINGSITNAIDWNSSLRSYLRTNKVNFFVNYNPKFLGSDLVGATASSSVGPDDRIGPSQLRAKLTQAINNVALRYIFNINNPITRNQVVSAIQTVMDPYAPYLDTTQTQIVCNSANNDDNTSTLTIWVTVKPILATESFAITLTYTQ
jgi:hypothetical protein